MANEYRVQIKKMPGTEDIPLPVRMSDAASGFDVFSAVSATVVIQPGERALIPAGFSLAMPNGLEAQIRPRSGLALKKGVTCLNSPGTIDADYRGEVGVILINLGSEPFEVKRGDRIAQMVFQEVPSVTLVETDKLDETTRGTGGFGHTGV